ncbi:uncharacterized protein Bfra_002413 [Botrytis fragariae]|uniref:Uncharacterized protein n=1 Tax=Botrytis fragariae TaxID=1964551 RepID=A0A8H6EKX4_9HELO|nr:uncharacterized protein Bfra_002413 [Botrytis fragariae]KAF5876016.1 hypothetical protein Bfra_002413 [Botrytis fragariae]
MAICLSFCPVMAVISSESREPSYFRVHLHPTLPSGIPFFPCACKSCSAIVTSATFQHKS